MLQSAGVYVLWIYSFLKFGKKIRDRYAVQFAELILKDLFYGSD
jgi:hypothetical protein